MTTLTADPAARRDIPEATVARLPVYLRALTGLAERRHRHRLLRGARRRRRGQLRQAAQGPLLPRLLRRARRRATTWSYLAYQISRELGLTQDWPVVIVGIGNLGHALANYSGFATRGFRVVALLDARPRRRRRGRSPGLADPPDDRPASRSSPSAGVAIGVIATPAAAAQDVCDRLVAAGVR